MSIYYYLSSNRGVNEEIILEPFLIPTEMRRNPYYSIYYINPATLLVTGVIPLALLAYWNYIIYKKIKSSSKMFAQNSTRSNRPRNGQRQENEFANPKMWEFKLKIAENHNLTLVFRNQYSYKLDLDLKRDCKMDTSDLCYKTILESVTKLKNCEALQFSSVLADNS